MHVAQATYKRAFSLFVLLSYNTVQMFVEIRNGNETYAHAAAGELGGEEAALGCRDRDVGGTGEGAAAKGSCQASAIVGIDRSS